MQGESQARRSTEVRAVLRVAKVKQFSGASVDENQSLPLGGSSTIRKPWSGLQDATNHIYSVAQGFGPSASVHQTLERCK